MIISQETIKDLLSMLDNYIEINEFNFVGEHDNKGELEDLQRILSDLQSPDPDLRIEVTFYTEEI